MQHHRVALCTQFCPWIQTTKLQYMYALSKLQTVHTVLFTSCDFRIHRPIHSYALWRNGLFYKPRYRILHEEILLKKSRCWICSTLKGQWIFKGFVLSVGRSLSTVSCLAFVVKFRVLLSSYWKGQMQTYRNFDSIVVISTVYWPTIWKKNLSAKNLGPRIFAAFPLWNSDLFPDCFHIPVCCLYNN